MVDMDRDNDFSEIDHTTVFEKPEVNNNYGSFESRKPNNFNTKTYDQNRSKGNYEFKVPEGTHIIYTDGGCRTNSNGYSVGAWAFYDISFDYSDSAAADNTTNNQMEMRAVIEALKYCKEKGISDPIEIRLDSEYVQKGMLFWTKKWKENDWMRVNNNTGEREEIKNLDLWKELDELAQYFSKQKIYWVKVKAHSGEEYNTKVDILCTESIDTFIKNME